MHEASDPQFLGGMDHGQREKEERDAPGPTEEQLEIAPIRPWMEVMLRSSVEPSTAEYHRIPLPKLLFEVI